MILLIDNYDSFTYNIYQAIGKMGYSVIVKKNDEIDLYKVHLLKITHVIISPGPMGPQNSNSVFSLIDYYKKKVPILGVCLGMQILYSYYGGKVSKSKNVMHGKMSKITHNGGAVFSGVPKKFTAMRYHSLSVDLKAIPDNIEITAYSEGQSPMGFDNKEDKTYGIQFHPEALLTEHGDRILKNFCLL